MLLVALRSVSMAQAVTPPAGDAAAAGTASAAGTAAVPQEDVMSSLKQAFKQDFDRQVVRGRFDVGSPPDVVHRYYCVVDVKTGVRQPNGVAGEPLPRADGMTGIKGTAVSLYSCASAERLGLLDTTGFVLNGAAAAHAGESRPAVAVAAAATPAASAPVTAARTTATTAATTAEAEAPAMGAPTAAPTGVADSAADRVDVAGVKLGMSLEAVRQLLKSKRLVDYRESTLTLAALDPSGGGTAATAGTRFVNVVAAWTTPVDGDGEAYEIMFTPVPGRERAMAIVHSVAYSAAHAVRETTLGAALVQKYGGYSTADGLPAAPTWRVQNTGDVQTGDSCKRRGVFGGLAGWGMGDASRPNLALHTTPDEFRYQIGACGVAIVTEDHVTAGGSRDERPVTRFTVTAYSPSIGFEGATAAAQLMLAGRPGAGRDDGAQAGAMRGKDTVPAL